MKPMVSFVISRMLQILVSSFYGCWRTELFARELLCKREKLYLDPMISIKYRSVWLPCMRTYQSMSYFDHFAAGPGTPLGQWIKRRMRYNALLRITPLIPDVSAAILEIGPGWGELAFCFQEAGYCNYTTVEPNQTMREHLKGRGFVTKNYLIPKI